MLIAPAILLILHCYLARYSCTFCLIYFFLSVVLVLDGLIKIRLLFRKGVCEFFPIPRLLSVELVQILHISFQSQINICLQIQSVSDFNLFIFARVLRPIFSHRHPLFSYFSFVCCSLSIMLILYTFFSNF